MATSCTEGYLGAKDNRNLTKLWQIARKCGVNDALTLGKYKMHLAPEIGTARPKERTLKFRSLFYFPKICRASKSIGRQELKSDPSIGKQAEQHKSDRQEKFRLIEVKRGAGG